MGRKHVHNFFVKTSFDWIMPTSRSNGNLQRGYQLNSSFSKILYYTYVLRLLFACFLIVDPDPGARDLDSCNLILLLKEFAYWVTKRSHGPLSFRLALPSPVSSSIFRQKLLTDKEERVYYVFTKGRTIRKVMGGGGEGNFRAAGIFFL